MLIKQPIEWHALSLQIMHTFFHCLRRYRMLLLLSLCIASKCMSRLVIPNCIGLVGSQQNYCWRISRFIQMKRAFGRTNTQEPGNLTVYPIL